MGFVDQCVNDFSIPDIATPTIDCRLIISYNTEAVFMGLWWTIWQKTRMLD